MSKIGINENKLSNNNIIEVSNLRCIFNEKQENETIALDNINISLEKNKIHFIIGNSGSGKSVLVYHFNGLLKSKQGELNIDNFLISGNKRKIKNPKLLRKIISLVFQFPEYQLFKDTIENDICFGPKVLNIPKEKSYIHNKNEIISKILNDKNLSNYLTKFFELKNYDELEKMLNTSAIIKFKFVPSKNIIKTKIKLNNKVNKMSLSINYKSPKEIGRDDACKYLKEMGLDETYLDRNPFGLSGGQKRRVAIAGILAIEPKILIFDEPIAGLDPKGEQEMMQTILRAKEKGQTVIVIIHNMDYALEFADNIIVLKDGKVFKEGSPYDIFTDSELYKNTKMDQPKVIDVINKLIEKDKKYNKLLKFKPKNVDELVQGIQKIKKGG